MWREEEWWPLLSGRWVWSGGLRERAIPYPENVLRPVHLAGPLSVQGALSDGGEATGDTSMGPNICGGDETPNRASRWRALEPSSEWWAFFRRQRDRPALQGYSMSPLALLLGRCSELAVRPSPLPS